MPQLIKACLGILCRNADGEREILLASRPAGKVMAGYWEFPGGKLEAQENAYLALQRELHEELGIITQVDAMYSLGQIEQQYPHGLAQLTIIEVKQWQGEISPEEGQQLYWHTLTSSLTISPLLPTTSMVIERYQDYSRGDLCSNI